MSLKKKIIRSLEQMTCDKFELNRTVLKLKKRLDEACSVLGDKKGKK